MHAATDGCGTHGEDQAPDRAGGNEDPTENHEGQWFVRAGERDELRQKGQEEQGNLGVEYIGEGTLAIDLPQSRTLMFYINLGCGSRGADKLDALVDQVDAAQVFQDRESRGRRGQDGASSRE